MLAIVAISMAAKAPRDWTAEKYRRFDRHERDAARLETAAVRRPRGATIRRHKSEMHRAANPIKWVFLCLLVLSLSSCGGVHVGDFIPHAIGGLPADAPPRPGTPEYDAWMAKRAEEAARPKTGQQSK